MERKILINNTKININGEEIKGIKRLGVLALTYLSIPFVLTFIIGFIVSVIGLSIVMAVPILVFAFIASLILMIFGKRIE